MNLKINMIYYSDKGLINTPLRYILTVKLAVEIFYLNLRKVLLT
jgi:hypothetical protein